MMKQQSCRLFKHSHIKSQKIHLMACSMYFTITFLIIVLLLTASITSLRKEMRNYVLELQNTVYKTYNYIL